MPACRAAVVEGDAAARFMEGDAPGPYVLAPELPAKGDVRLLSSGEESDDICIIEVVGSMAAAPAEGACSAAAVRYPRARKNRVMEARTSRLWPICEYKTSSVIASGARGIPCCASFSASSDFTSITASGFCSRMANICAAVSGWIALSVADAEPSKALASL